MKLIEFTGRSNQTIVYTTYFKSLKKVVILYPNNTSEVLIKKAKLTF